MKMNHLTENLRGRIQIKCNYFLKKKKINNDE